MASKRQPKPLDTKITLLYEAKKKNVFLAYAFLIFVGYLGVHRFYLQRISGFGMLCLFVFGFAQFFQGALLMQDGTTLPVVFLSPLVRSFVCFFAVFVWMVVDLFLLHGWVERYNSNLLEELIPDNSASRRAKKPMQLKQAKAEPVQSKQAKAEPVQSKRAKAKAMQEYEAKKKNGTVAILYAFFLGIFGAHRLYLRMHSGWIMLGLSIIGLAYGLDGIILIVAVFIWVLFDICFLDTFVERYNRKLLDELMPDAPTPRKTKKASRAKKKTQAKKASQTKKASPSGKKASQSAKKVTKAKKS